MIYIGVLQDCHVDSSTTNETYYITFCVRDGKDSITQVMDSCINQTLRPSKIIVVDDGSTDGTREILETYCTKYPEIVELMETNSTTRDYSRIPKLWNLGLRRGYDYHMICAGDAALSPQYAERILTVMSSDPNLVICSGDYGLRNAKAPHGAGRFVRQSFFFENYDSYPFIVGYESEILERALAKGHRIHVLNDAEFYHLDKLGHGHNFREFGYSMRSLGYYPLYALGRIMLVFLHDKNIGKIGAMNMLRYYLFFRPSKSGYYSLFPEDVRNFIGNRQKQAVKRYLNRLWTRFASKKSEKPEDKRSAGTLGRNTVTVLPQTSEEFTSIGKQQQRQQHDRSVN